MNLFRSEEHVRRWEHFIPESSGSIMPVADQVTVQGTESRRHWLDDDYLSRWFPQRARERVEALEKLDIDIKKIATAHNARIFTMKEMQASVAGYVPAKCTGGRSICL